MTTTIAPATLPTTLLIEVTDEDIREGVTCSAHLCPLARAVSTWLWRNGIRAVQVSVMPMDVEITLDWGEPTVKYWHDARSWVVRYDADFHVEPRPVSLIRVA